MVNSNLLSFKQQIPQVWRHPEDTCPFLQKFSRRLSSSPNQRQVWSGFWSILNAGSSPHLTVGALVGWTVGGLDGAFVGFFVGWAVGEGVLPIGGEFGFLVGALVGLLVGCTVGLRLGGLVGAFVGLAVNLVGGGVGSFNNTADWQKSQETGHASRTILPIDHLLQYLLTLLGSSAIHLQSLSKGSVFLSLNL